MSTDPPETTRDQQVRISSAYETFKHNASLAMLVVAPVLIAIPPRKLDLYTFSLTGAFVASINQLTVERTGKGLISQFSYRPVRTGEETQRQLWDGSDRRRLLEEKAGVPEEVTRRSAGVVGSVEGRVKELWMGGETEGWKEKRLKEEQEKLNQGEGYGGMIMDQIWEVWNQGEKKAEELKEKDEKVLEEKRKTEQRRSGS